MFKHMLIPLDGSRLAEVALPLATVMAAKLGARITLLHVLERGAPQQIHGEPHLIDTAGADRYLAETAGRYAADGVQIDYHVHAVEEGNVAASIAAHAAELSADMIALTTHGGSDLRRILIGSIAQVVLQRGQVPVLLVPAHLKQEAPFSLRSILVPLRGHRAVAAVLPLARELARAFDARLQLLEVVPTLGTLSGERASVAMLTPIAATSSLDLEEESAAERLGQLVKDWQGDQQPTFEVRRGDPTETILGVIAQMEPDLVVIATHGRAGLPGLWAASVAPRVASRTTRPMLLIRVAGPEEE